MPTIAAATTTPPHNAAFFSASSIIHGVILLALLVVAASAVLYVLRQRTTLRPRANSRAASYAASRRSSICSERYPLLLDVDEEHAATVDGGQSHVLHLYRHEEDMSLAPRGLLSDLDHTQQQQEDKYLGRQPSFANGSSSSWYGRWWKRRSKQQQSSRT